MLDRGEFHVTDETELDERFFPLNTSGRLVQISSHLVDRLMRLEQWKEALRVLQVLGQSMEILRDRQVIHDNNKFKWQTSALDKLSICIPTWAASILL